MLSGSNDEKLAYKKVDSKVVPLYQVWQELVHVQTLDVYQYRVLTSFSALKELLAVIEKTQQGLFTTDDNIDACRLETLYILSIWSGFLQNLRQVSHAAMLVILNTFPI